MNPADIVVILIIVAMLAAGFGVKHLRKKNGRSTCCGSCGNCGPDCHCNEDKKK